MNENDKEIYESIEILKSSAAEALENIAAALAEFVASIDFERLAKIAEEFEDIKTMERERMPRPKKSTINKRYVQPVLTVRRTARSRLR